MSKRVLVVEWVDADNIEVRFAVRADDNSKAILVLVSVGIGTGLVGVPTIYRCTPDPAGDRCRVLGGVSTHADVTADLIQDAMTAFGQGDQEGLYAYFEGVL